MRCKVGDLVVIVRTHPMWAEAIGRFATVVSPDDIAGHWNLDIRIDDRCVSAPDAYLRPIRDSDGQDEMLRIAGLPKNLELIS